MGLNSSKAPPIVKFLARYRAVTQTANALPYSVF